LGTVEEMTREEGPERTQRTVAELLAKYGANSEENAPRRRRRRAEDAEDTAPQAIIDRVMSDSGTFPPVRGDEPQPQQPPAQPPPVAAPPPGAPQPPPRPSGRRRSAPQASQPLPQPPPQPPPVAPQAAPEALQPTQRQMPPVAPPERRERRQAEQRPLPQPPQPSQQMPQPPQPSQQMPRPKPQPQPSQKLPQPPGVQSGQWPTPPAEKGGLSARLDGRQESRSDLRPVAPPPPVREGVTEQMPRITDETPAPGMRTGQHPPPHRVARTSRAPQPPPPVFPQHEPDEDDNYPTEYHGFEPVVDDAPYEATQYVEGVQQPAAGYESTQFVDGIDLEDDYDDEPDRSIEHDRPVGVDDDYADEDEDAGEKRPSPIREWLSMAGQLAIGVVGGAALWLGFNWLWGKIPTAALAVAVVVIVGLVWVVRKIRRADDLQTTILTVLVGLVVTVSPAAMLLLNR
jgi:hypothetical protein